VARRSGRAGHAAGRGHPALPRGQQPLGTDLAAAPQPDSHRLTRPWPATPRRQRQVTCQSPTNLTRTRPVPACMPVAVRYCSVVATKPSGPPGRWYLSRDDRGPVNRARDHGDDRLAGVELHQITES